MIAKHGGRYLTKGGILQSIAIAFVILVPVSKTQATEVVRPGTDYSVARKQLLSKGYTPLTFPKQDCLDNVSGRDTICEAYPETRWCAGTGLANCEFVFQNRAGAFLFVETVGEEQNVQGREIGNDLGVKRTRAPTAEERAELQPFSIQRTKR